MVEGGHGATLAPAADRSPDRLPIDPRSIADRSGHRLDITGL